MIMISSARILPHHTDGLDEDQPRAEESSDEEHAEGTALRYATSAFVWFAKALARPLTNTTFSQNP